MGQSRISTHLRLLQEAVLLQSRREGKRTFYRLNENADPSARDIIARIITSNCGGRVQHMDDARLKEIFAELEQFGVRHDDADLRNVTYRQSDGRFCLIDFEFATILPRTEQPSAT